MLNLHINIKYFLIFYQVIIMDITLIKLLSLHLLNNWTDKLIIFQYLFKPFINQINFKLMRNLKDLKLIIHLYYQFILF